MSVPPEDRPASERLHSPMIGGVNIREVAGCTCLRLRRSSRTATQLFDAQLIKVGLTIGQFGVMAQLYGVGILRESISVKALAHLIGMDATTLVRTLKPLEKHAFVTGRVDPVDRRSRLIKLTRQGEQKLAEAMPHWSEAQATVRARVGEAPTLALNGLLDLTSQSLRSD